jgi:type II secretory pathway pseudopilin PulG
MTLVELVIVLGMIAALLAFAGSTMASWSTDQRAATSARALADAFSLARAEAIRTGSNHIVAFDIESGLDGIGSDVVIVNDGPPGDVSGVSSNCRIDDGGLAHSISLEQGVSFGSDPALANGTPAPNDSGASGNQAAGSSFTDADSPAGDASWVMFGADGLPRRFAQGADADPPCEDLGPVGDAGGAIYVTNGRRDYAIVLSPLGTVRLHRWNSGAAAWTQ